MRRVLGENGANKRARGNHHSRTLNNAVSVSGISISHPILIDVRGKTSIDENKVNSPLRRTPEKKLSFLDNPEVFNGYYMKYSDYWRLLFAVHEADQRLKGTRFNSGGLILKQLLEEGERDYAKWRKRTKAMERSNNGAWKACILVDYIIGCEEKHVGGPISGRLLVKFDQFPVPTWVENENVVEESFERLLFDRRNAECDLIELQLRESTSPSQMETWYPERYLSHEIGEGGYVKSKAALYRNKLMAMEDSWNCVLGPNGIELILEDWTGRHEGIEQLGNFKFINNLVISSTVQSFLRSQKPLDNTYCRNCKGCTITSERAGQYCCENHTERSSSGETINYACTERCQNGGKLSDLHRGRRIRVCIFLDHQKGWSVRTLREIEKDQYFTQIVGELLEKPTTTPNLDFEMGTNPPNCNKPLTIATENMSNEGRFVNHSCNPNLECFSVMLERYGHWFTRKCLYAKRHIVAGEELLYDYFAGYTLEQKLRTKMFERCLCGTQACYERKRIN